MAGTQASLHLDLIRGLAAIQVFLFHGFGVFFADRTAGDPRHIAALRMTISYGHEAVVVFFVLSGLVISNSVFRDLQTGRWSWRRYFVSRATRMYLVAIPALILTFGLDHLGISQFSSRVDLTDVNNLWINPVLIGERLSRTILAGNLLFLQNIAVPPLGSNAPLWSLANEWWYYCIFPLAFFAWLGGSPTRTRLGLAAVGVVLLVFVGQDLAAYFLIWLLGVGVVLAHARRGPHSPRPSRSMIGIAATLVLGSLALITRLRWRFPDQKFLLDLILGVAVAALLFALTTDQRPATAGWYRTVSRTVAGHSFTLYATHVPLLVFARLWLSPEHRWSPTNTNVWWWLLVIVTVYFTCYVLAKYTEARTDEVRRWALARSPGSQGI